MRSVTIDTTCNDEFVDCWVSSKSTAVDIRFGWRKDDTSVRYGWINYDAEDKHKERDLATDIINKLCHFAMFRLAGATA